MNFQDQALLIEKVTNIFVDTHNFHDLAKKAVTLMTEQLKGHSLIAAGIFRLNEKQGTVDAYAYSTTYSHVINKILPAKFSQLKIPLTEKENLVLKCIQSNQIQQSHKISDFSHGTIPDSTADKIQSVLKVKLLVGFPVRVVSGRVAGVLLVGILQEKLSAEQLTLFETFAKQLGLAFSNVFAFEKLLEKYKNTFDHQLHHISEQDIPSIKFTLRITPAEEKKLKQLVGEKGKTKAEVLRELIDMA